MADLSEFDDYVDLSTYLRQLEAETAARDATCPSPEELIDVDSSELDNESASSFDDEFDTNITADQLLRADESGTLSSSSSSEAEEEVRPNKGGRPPKPKRSGRPPTKKLSREAELAQSLAEVEERIRLAQQAFIQKSLECEELKEQLRQPPESHTAESEVSDEMASAIWFNARDFLIAKERARERGDKVPKPTHPKGMEPGPLTLGGKRLLRQLHATGNFTPTELKLLFRLKFHALLVPCV
eukprot:PhM_4_TR17458/c0_g1_i1/m.36743